MAVRRRERNRLERGRAGMSLLSRPNQIWLFGPMMKTIDGFVSLKTRFWQMREKNKRLLTTKRCSGVSRPISFIVACSSISRQKDRAHSRGSSSRWGIQQLSGCRMMFEVRPRIPDSLRLTSTRSA